MNNYEQKRQAKIERYKELAEKADRESTSAYKQSTEMASVIPFGQPILVGHHSEKKDRNYRDKIHNKMGKSVEASKKAEYYLEKAKAAEHNTSISSDNPDALSLLKEKVDKLEESQRKMKATNSAWRTYDKKGDSSQLEELGINAHQLADQIECAHSWNKQPYPSYELTNLNAKIRNTKKRIASLEKAESIEHKEIDYGQLKAVQNVELNRIQLIFPDIPSQEIRTFLKTWGFKWSRSNVAWQRHLNANGFYAAKQVIAFVKSNIAQ